MATCTSKMISRGRTTFPRALMEDLGLPNGGLVIFEDGPDGSVILRKATDDEVAERRARGTQKT